MGRVRLNRVRTFRWEFVIFCERKEQTLYELTARLIMRHKVAISRQALAKHLDVLEKAGLVSSEKRGKYRMLVFNDEPLRAVMDRWLK